MAGQTTTSKDLRVHIRWMIRRDFPEVLTIEWEGFPFPWSEEEFVICLRQRNCIGMVAEHDNRIVGFMLYELHPKRIQLLEFAVAADCRRRGIGRAMLKTIKNKITAQRRSQIRVEVDDRNVDGQLFVRSQGFVADTFLRGFYGSGWIDAEGHEHPDAILFVWQCRMKNAECRMKNAG